MDAIAVSVILWVAIMTWASLCIAGALHLMNIRPLGASNAKWILSIVLLGTVGSVGVAVKKIFEGVNRTSAGSQLVGVCSPDKATDFVSFLQEVVEKSDCKLLFSQFAVKKGYFEAENVEIVDAIVRSLPVRRDGVSDFEWRQQELLPAITRKPVVKKLQQLAHARQLPFVPGVLEAIVSKPSAMAPTNGKVFVTSAEMDGKNVRLREPESGCELVVLAEKRIALPDALPVVVHVNEDQMRYLFGNRLGKVPAEIGLVQSGLDINDLSKTRVCSRYGS